MEPPEQKEKALTKKRSLPSRAAPVSIRRTFSSLHDPRSSFRGERSRHVSSTASAPTIRHRSAPPSRAISLTLRPHRRRVNTRRGDAARSAHRHARDFSTPTAHPFHLFLPAYVLLGVTSSRCPITSHSPSRSGDLLPPTACCCLHPCASASAAAACLYKLCKVQPHSRVRCH